MKQQTTTTTATDNLVLDEGTFDRLLSAAHVLQQENGRSQDGSETGSRYARTRAEILEVQDEIHTRRLDLEAAARLIARRAREITDAAGAAVGIQEGWEITNAAGTPVGVLDGNQLRYYAATGSAAGCAGSRMPFDSSLAAECLRSGQVLCCSNTETDARLPAELCRRHYVRALIAAPVGHEGKVTGVVELHFARPDSFQEHAVHTCQLMAALLALVIARSIQSEAQSSVSSARTTASAATQKSNLKLDRLVGRPTTTPVPPPASSPIAPAAAACQDCGHQMGEGELFCGICGTAFIRSPWSSLLQMHRAGHKSETNASANKALTAEHGALEGLDVFPSDLEEIVAQFANDPHWTEPINHREPKVALPSFASNLSEEVPAKPEGDTKPRPTSEENSPPGKTPTGRKARLIFGMLMALAMLFVTLAPGTGSGLLDTKLSLLPLTVGVWAIFVVLFVKMN